MKVLNEVCTKETICPCDQRIQVILSDDEKKTESPCSSKDRVTQFLCQIAQVEAWPEIKPIP